MVGWQGQYTAYLSAQVRGGARTGKVRHAVHPDEHPGTERTMCGRPARIVDDDGIMWRHRLSVQCPACAKAVVQADAAERDAQLRAADERLAGLWLVFFGTRIEVVAGDDADSARARWIADTFAYHGGEGDPLRARFAPVTPDEVAVRALTQVDLDRFASWDVSFGARVLKLMKQRAKEQREKERHDKAG